MDKKKLLLFGVILVLTSVLCISTVFAEFPSNVMITVNGSNLSVNKCLSDGVLCVPAKELCEIMGGSFTYEQATLTGTLKSKENELVFRLNDSVAKLNGKYVKAPTAMKIQNYRFVVPIEFTVKSLGAEMIYGSSRNQLMIFTSKNGNLVYKVQSGDTLWIISNLFGTTINSLTNLNGLTSTQLDVGQSLIIRDLNPSIFSAKAFTSKGATLRNGADINCAVLGYLLAWTPITVTGKNGDWYRVDTPKGSGYIHQSIVYINQDISDTAADSTYFERNIPIDTTQDYITYKSYTVRVGDSIWLISEAFGIPDYELADCNNISTTSNLKVGQVIKIPVHNIPIKRITGTEYGEVLDWFSEAQYVFYIGKVGKLIDLETQKSFMIKRTMGANHSDTETLTQSDTEMMKQIFGGRWSWDRRPFILEVDGRRLAVSVAGMEHAGVDGLPYLKNVYDRSDNYGYGPNYDRISGNGMDGHFDLYFLNCLRHKDNKIDSSHQFRVLKAGGLR